MTWAYEATSEARRELLWKARKVTKAMPREQLEECASWLLAGFALREAAGFCDLSGDAQAAAALQEMRNTERAP